MPHSAVPVLDVAERKTELLERFKEVRRFTEQLCAPLTPEDCTVQSMPDVSPTRWHLAHTTWFFETFVLGEALQDYRPFDPNFAYLFNSYYNSVGHQFPRSNRGLISRPTLAGIQQYRQHVDMLIEQLLSDSAAPGADRLSVIELGLHHEQQHQELLLTDIKHVLSCNPLCPVYQEPPRSTLHEAAPPLTWSRFQEGLRWIGHDLGTNGFAFDNESPRHRVFLDDFALADRLVTCGEYMEFMEDGGYQRPELWLSDGWSQVQAQQWQAPLYWQRRDGGWGHFTLGGFLPVDLDEPVCHVSYFEADAFAHWAGARLPTEAEWEVASLSRHMTGNFVERSQFHPRSAPLRSGEGPGQMFGDVWEWTASPYVAFPGYRPPRGALGEYNGKFMCNQFVLRGGSCATSQTHIRRTYRNFFPAHTRWQFSGIRLARSERDQIV